MLGNFCLGKELSFAFIPGHLNTAADLLLRWYARGEDVSSRFLVGEMNDDTDILQRAHKGHYGLNKTMDIIKAWGYSIPREKVSDFLSKCEVCHQFRHKGKPSSLGAFCNTTQKNQVLGLDFMGPLPKTWQGYRYIISVVDFY